MSWRERLNVPYQITTGDGKKYFPKWIGASIDQQYNISSFDFKNVSGTLVVREQPKGRRFKIRLFFDGDNHVETAEAFRISSGDKRPWLVLHPYYGELRVHPAGLNINNDDYNVSVVTGFLLETIEGTYPRSQSSPADEVIEKKELSNELAIESYSLNVSILPVSEVTPISGTIDIMEASTEDVIETDDEAFNFRNTLSKARSSVDTAISKPLDLARNIQSVIDFPFSISNSVKARVNLLIDQFERVKTSLGNLADFNRERSSYLETVGTTYTSAIVAAAVTDVDFSNSDEVTDTITAILNHHNGFIATLDELQSEDGKDPESYIPEANSMIALDEIVNFAVSNLFQIVYDVPTANKIILESDTNPIVLAHRLYGPDPDDLNIDRLINENNLKFSELLNIPKGKEIVYYV